MICLSDNKTKEEIKKIEQPKYAEIFKSFANEFPKLTDKELHSRTEKAMQFESEIFKNYVTDKNDNKYFSLSRFLTGAGYLDNFSKNTNLYSPEQIETFVQNPENSQNELMTLSYKLYNYIQEYKQLVNRYANLLNYYPVVLPKDDVSIDGFIDTLRYFEGYNYKTKLPEITKKLLIQDIFFGYELSRRGTNKKVLKEMPRKYCKITGKDEYGVYLYKFDLTYFDNNTDALNHFPAEFRFRYDQFKDGDRDRWFEPDPTRQFAFKFEDGFKYSLPYFSGVFVDLARLQEVKVAQTIASKLENYKLIHFKMPINEKSGKMDDYLINPDDATVYHQMAKNHLPEGAGLVTNPFTLESVNLKNNSDANSNIIDRHYTSMMSSAGMSRLLTNSNTSGSTGLQGSIEVDESIMFKVLRQYEAFFTRQLNYRRVKSSYNVTFLDSTIHNKHELNTMYKELANTGFNRFFVSSSAGISQLELIYGRKVEQALDLDELLDPLATAHTMSGNDEDDVAKTDEGARTQDKE